MRNALIFLNLVLLHINAVAQDKWNDNPNKYPVIVNEVLNDLNLYGIENFYRLILLKQDDKWGYLDKKTLKSS